MYSNIILHQWGCQGDFAQIAISPSNVFTGERTVVACEGQEVDIKCGKSVHISFYRLYVNVYFFKWFSLGLLKTHFEWNVLIIK